MGFPCKDCNDREIGCHGRCEKYKIAKQEHNDIIEKTRMSDIAHFVEVRDRSAVWARNPNKYGKRYGKRRKFGREYE